MLDLVAKAHVMGVKPLDPLRLHPDAEVLALVGRGILEFEVPLDELIANGDYAGAADQFTAGGAVEGHRFVLAIDDACAVCGGEPKDQIHDGHDD